MSESSGGDEPKRPDLRLANLQIARYARSLLHSAATRDADAVEAARKRLVLYARDLKTAFEPERRKTRELEKAYHDTIRRLIMASRFKDEETGAHIRRIGIYSRVMALKLGLKPTEADIIAEAAPMHDIGKIGVPDSVLRHQGPLSDEQWSAMKKHPAFGASLMMGSASPLLEAARQIALTHHERWDGTGYPRALRGDQIPMSGRIVMLADQYDALRSRRPYKPPFDHATVCRTLLEGDGRTRPEHFDPAVLDAFGALEGEFDAIYGRNHD